MNLDIVENYFRSNFQISPASKLLVIHFQKRNSNADLPFTITDYRCQLFMEILTTLMRNREKSLKFLSNGRKWDLCRNFDFDGKYDLTESELLHEIASLIPNDDQKLDIFLVYNEQAKFMANGFVEKIHEEYPNVTIFKCLVGLVKFRDSGKLCSR